MDGTKLLLENDNWALLRFSGTEPVLRLAVEADSAEKAKELSRGCGSSRRKGEPCDTGILTMRTGST